MATEKKDIPFEVIKDTLTRDDLRNSSTPAFDALSHPMQKAFSKAASGACSLLPRDMGEGWMMVPTRRGLVQVAYSGRKAWQL